MGVVTQTAYLFPGTLADNLRFGPLQQGIDLSAETIEALLTEVGLDGRSGDDVAHLSEAYDARVTGPNRKFWFENYLNLDGTVHSKAAGVQFRLPRSRCFLRSLLETPINSV